MIEEETSIEPIYQTKDGQTVTHSQLVESGYQPERIDKGLQNGILKKVGDTNDPNQTFKTKDGQVITTQDLLHSGYTQDRIDKGVHNGILMPNIEKKNLGTTSSNVGATPSDNGLSTTPKDEVIEQPVASPKNPIDLAADYNILSNAKKEISMGAGGVAMGTGSAEVPDEEKTKAAQDLRDKTLKESGIDLHDLANETKGLIENDFGKQGFSKEELLNDRATNNELYHRKLNSLKWKSGLDSELANQLVNGNIDKDVYDGLKHNIDVSLQNAGTGTFEQQRQNINSVANTIKEYGGEKKDELLNNYAVEAAKVYGNSWKSGGVKAPEDTPESKYLTNPNAELGYQYLKDISPDKAAQYERLFIDPKSIKDDPDAQKGYSHLMQTLEETGIALQDNAVKEDYNNLVNISKKNGGLSPEQLDQAKKLTEKQDELTKAKAELDSKYPDRVEDKVSDAMTEILGQKLGWGMYAGGMAGKAFKNTGEGIWEMVSEPFMSDQSNTQRELALMGESKFDEDVYKKSDANKGLQTDRLVIDPKLQTQIDAIKSNKSLTDTQKEQQLYPLLKSNTDKFGRVPIEGGKMNISPSSILYGLTDLGTTLMPYLAIEAATGGIGGTSTAAKFLRSYTAAAATGFHDEYANAVKSGKSESEAFKQALGVTAINSAAMAGAGTGEKVKALFAGSKSSAAKIIEGMSEDAIDKVLAEGTPKGFKALKESLTGRIKQVPNQLLQGVKTGATFEAAMTGAKEAQHQIYNTPIDREQNFKQSLLNIANFGLAGVIGGQVGYKSPTELQKSNLIEFGKNPEGFLATAEKMKRDGQLTQQELDHRKDLIEKAGAAYKALPKSNAKGKPLSEKEKGEYLYNNVIKNAAKKEAADLPPKQAEKSLHVSMVADYKNDIILENPTDKQLESRKATLEKQIENKDEEGKPLLNDAEIAKVKAQLDAVNETIDQRSKTNAVGDKYTVPEAPVLKGEPEQISQPIELSPTGNESVTYGIFKEPKSENKPSDENIQATENTNAETKTSPTVEETNPNIQPTEEGTGEGEGNKVGVSHESLSKLSERLGLKQPERGDYIEPQEYAERGRKLLEAGASLDEVDNKSNDLHDRISIARAHLEDLTNIADNIAKKEGTNSDAYKDAVKEVERYALDKVKKLGTLAHRAFTSLQGERDLNTGSFTAVKKVFEDSKGSKASPEQEQKIKDLTDLNEKLKNQANDLEKKLIEETDKNIGKEKSEKGKFEKKARGLADKILKSELPSWLKIDDPNVKTQGIGAEAAKKLLADATINMGKLLDKGVEFSQAVKEAVEDLVKVFGENKRDEIEKGFTQHYKDITKQANKLSDLQKMFLNKTDNKFTPDEARGVWDYAKSEYLDKGVHYKDMISYVSRDLGLSWKQISEAITSPKVKAISDAMYKRQADYRKIQVQVKDYVERVHMGVAKKAVKGVSDLFRSIAVFGHGHIFVGTHAGMTLFDLPRVQHTLKAFGKGIQYAYGNTATYEREMQMLQSKPNFVLAERAGLQNNPNETRLDDYQNSSSHMGKFMARVGLTGVRGFNAIKVLRQELFDSHFNKLSAADKADPSTAESIAHLVNNATGATNVSIPRWTQEVAFAANMEAARWEKLTRNPYKATEVALKALLAPDKVTPAQRVFAKVWASRVGWEVATYASILGLNAAIQNIANPKNPVNLTKPNQPDFLKFKAGDHDINPTSGMLGAIQFISSTSKIANEDQKDLKGDTRLQAYGKNTFGYLRGKLAPAAGVATDLLTHVNYSGDVLPFFSDKPRTGRHILTYGEYAWEKAPLPLADAAKTVYESMRENGMSKPQAENWWAGAATMLEAASTGFRVSKSYGKDIGIKDQESPAYNFLKSKDLRVIPYSVENLNPIDHRGKPIDVKPEDYKDFMEKRELYIKTAIDQALNNGGRVDLNPKQDVEVSDDIQEVLDNIEEKQKGIKKISSEDFKNATPEELSKWLMVETTQADEWAMRKVFNGKEMPKDKPERKILPIHPKIR